MSIERFKKTRLKKRVHPQNKKKMLYKTENKTTPGNLTMI